MIFLATLDVLRWEFKRIITVHIPTPEVRPALVNKTTYGMPINVGPAAMATKLARRIVTLVCGTKGKPFIAKWPNAFHASAISLP